MTHWSAHGKGLAWHRYQSGARRGLYTQERVRLTGERTSLAGRRDACYRGVMLTGDAAYGYIWVASLRRLSIILTKLGHASAIVGIYQSRASNRGRSLSFNNSNSMAVMACRTVSTGIISMYMGADIFERCAPSLIIWYRNCACWRSRLHGTAAMARRQQALDGAGNVVIYTGIEAWETKARTVSSSGSGEARHLEICGGRWRR